MNEYLFYYREYSIIVNALMFSVGLTLVMFNKRYSFVYIVLTGILLNIRPRELHLVPIDLRGSFEYFSFASQKVIGLSFHTWLMIIFGIRYFKSFRTRGLIVFLCFIGLLFISTAVGFATDRIVIWGLRSDLRWLVFLILGLGIKVTREDFKSASDWLLTTAFICLLCYIIIDLSAGHSKFDYSPDIVLVLPFLLFGYNKSSLSRFKRLMIPVSRTDILLYGLSWIKSWRSALLTITFASTGLFLLLNANVKEDSFIGLLQRKSEIIKSLSIDKSSNVRLNEWKVVNSSNLYYKSLGSGLGSYVDLLQIESALDRADFSPRELSEYRGIQPHFFVTYMFLKFGWIGCLIFLFYTLLMLNKINIQMIVLLLGLLFGFYWIPFVALMYGLILRNSDNIYSRPELS